MSIDIPNKISSDTPHPGFYYLTFNIILSAISTSPSSSFLWENFGLIFYRPRHHSFGTPINRAFQPIFFHLAVANLCYSDSYIMGGTEEGKSTVLGYAEDGVNVDQPGQNEERSEKVLTAEAQVGFADEKELGPRAALKTYSNAVMWSLVFAACVIMEGYDTALLGSFYAYRKGTTPLWMSGY